MSLIQRLSPGPQLAHTPEYRALPHILLVVDGFPKALGGGERIVLRLATLLPQYGFRASILTLALHPESSFRPSEAPCPVYLLPLTSAYNMKALRGALALRQFLRNERVQIVQTFFESSDLWAGLVTRLFSPAKLIWSRRDMGILRGPKHTRAYHALRHLPHAVFAVSKRVAQHVIEVDGVPASRVHVVYNGLDLDTSSPRAPRPATQVPVVTTIGNVRHVKGHDVLLDAIPSILRKFPDVVFTFAGEVLEPEYFAGLQSKIESLGLTSNVRFLGNVTDLPSHLENASLFVLPSRSEGFSNALIEAMAAGLPCVATDVGGNAEAIQDGENGIIIPANDSAALADAISGLLANPERASQVGIAARYSVEAAFSSAAMMKTVARLYQEQLGT